MSNRGRPVGTEIGWEHSCGFAKLNVIVLFFSGIEQCSLLFSTFSDIQAAQRKFKWLYLQLCFEFAAMLNVDEC
jgi:hypothetical protein